jgi:hypothetical protein
MPSCSSAAAVGSGCPYFCTCAPDAHDRPLDLRGVISDPVTHGIRARLIGLAGKHSDSGIRSFYHAIAAMAWFFHQLLFMATTTCVILILARRDFFSRSLRLIAGTGRA